MCNPVRVGSLEIEAHVIQKRTYALARDLAEASGALVYWDQAEQLTRVVSATPPAWDSFGPLVAANHRWRTDCRMHQARFDHIWASALRRRVDPRLMLAILIQEGTGSFNTNPANAGDYNGNGPDADWIVDTARAVSHVAGKLAWYGAAVGAGFVSAASTLGLDGTALQFINWPGPILGHTPTWGVYAQHADWWPGVSRAFTELGGDVQLLSVYWADRDVDGLPPAELRCEAVTNRPELCSDLTGTVGRPGVVTWVN